MLLPDSGDVVQAMKAGIMEMADIFVVHKADDGQVTTSGVREVAAADRVDELARMMAGLEGTDAARAHAAELLAEASRG